jgi:hypothetical protein
VASRFYDEDRPIAFAEMAATIAGLLTFSWTLRNLADPLSRALLTH